MRRAYGRLEKPELLTRQEFWGDRFWYIAYFQEPGVAEAELEANLRRTLRLIYYGMSGESKRAAVDFNKPKTAGLLEGMQKNWLSQC